MIINIIITDITTTDTHTIEKEGMIRKIPKTLSRCKLQILNCII